MPPPISKLLPNKRARIMVSTPRYRRAVRAMAEKAVDQGREVYDRSKGCSRRIGCDT